MKEKKEIITKTWILHERKSSYYGKVLVLNFSEMGNTVFFWFKKLMLDDIPGYLFMIFQDLGNMVFRAVLLLSLLFLLLLSLLLLLCCYHSHHYYFFSIIYVIHFVLFHFILFFYCSCYYDFCLLVCVTCMCPLVNYFFSLVNDLHFRVALLIHVKNHFSFVIIVYIIIVIITIILFFSALLVIGGEFSKWIRAAWSTPTHWLLWVSRRVSCFFFLFFVSYSLVTTVEVLTPSFIFIIWHHLIMMPRRHGM